MQQKLVAVLVLTTVLLLVLAGSALAQATPSITITIPLAGELVSPVQVVVTGTATAVPENNVVVRALDSMGNVLAEAPTTVAAPVGGTGNWSVTLNLVNVTPGTPGQIVAFSTSPATGAITTEARINVTYGSVQVVTPTQPPQAVPLPVSITLTNPVNGAVLDITGGSANISGTAFGTFENNVVVQVRDQLGRTVRREATTADASGNWAVSIEMLAPNGASGSIRAFSTSPFDGSVEAEAVVNVTFASTCTPRTDWEVYILEPGDSVLSIAQRTGSTVDELTVANCLFNPSVIFAGEQLRVPRLPDAGTPPTENTAVVITSPGPGTAIGLVNSIIVTGYTVDVDEGNTFVRLLDAAGAVIDEQRVIVTTQTNDQGQWDWQAQLDLAGAVDGSHGILYAYTVSPVDASIAAAATVPVVYGNASAATFVTITSPQPYSQLDLSQGVVVNGTGGGLFEGTVVVQALDDAGNLIAEVPTIIDAPDAGTGGQGNWQVTLQVPETRRGQIVALSTSPQDGSIVAYAAIDVIFGDPTQNPTYALLNFPLPRTVITNVTPFVLLAGQVGGLSANDTVNLNILDENDNILLSDVVDVDPTTGLWRIVSTTNAEIQANRFLKAQVMALSPDGAVIAADNIPIETRAVDIIAPPIAPQPTNTPPTATPSVGQPQPGIVISMPMAGDMVNPSQVIVNGTGTALPENNVVVQALDSAGNIVAEVPTTVAAPLGGTGNWSVTLNLSNVTPGTPGQIVAFSPSPATGANVAEARIDVTYGSTQIVDPLPRLTIAVPVPGEVVSPVQVVVNGTGTALPENNVVVQALDNGGNVLAEVPTIVDAPLGGTGNWSVVLNLANVAAGTPGQIVAYSTSPADGSRVAEARINVTYGR